MTIGGISGAYGYNSYMGYGAMSGVGMDQGVSDSGAVTGIGADEEKGQAGKIGRTSSPQECETCKNRKYQDGSNEMNVSFKSAAHISPEAASSEVRAHEGMHVKNAYAKASKANGQVVSANVAIHTSVCPECGRTYVSGGTTTTAIRYPNESNPYQQSRKSQDSLSTAGANVDYAV